MITLWVNRGSKRKDTMSGKIRHIGWVENANLHALNLPADLAEYRRWHLTIHTNGRLTLQKVNNPLYLIEYDQDDGKFHVRDANFPLIPPYNRAFVNLDAAQRHVEKIHDLIRAKNKGNNHEDGQ
jgi:hypothetical protein